MALVLFGQLDRRDGDGMTPNSAYKSIHGCATSATVGRLKVCANARLPRAAITCVDQRRQCRRNSRAAALNSSGASMLQACPTPARTTSLEPEMAVRRSSATAGGARTSRSAVHQQRRDLDGRGVGRGRSRPTPSPSPGSRSDETPACWCGTRPASHAGWSWQNMVGSNASTNASGVPSARGRAPDEGVARPASGGSETCPPRVCRRQDQRIRTSPRGVAGTRGRRCRRTRARRCTPCGGPLPPGIQRGSRA